MSPTKEYAFSVVINNVIYSSNTSPVLDESYHFITSIYDYDNSLLEIYLDGELEQSVTITGLLDDTTDDFYIGDYNGSSALHFFKGMIDDIRIYDRVLIEDEIEQLYSDGGWLSNPENVMIEIISENINLTWDAVVGATSYKVYSSDDPYAEFVEDTSGTFDGENWIAPIPNGKKFYYVTAVH